MTCSTCNKTSLGCEEAATMSRDHDVVAWFATRGAGAIRFLAMQAARELNSLSDARIIVALSAPNDLDDFKGEVKALLNESIPDAALSRIEAMPEDACVEDYDEVPGRLLLLNQKPKFRSSKEARRLFPKTYFAASCQTRRAAGSEIFLGTEEATAALEKLS